jgi:hypothetical protein
MKKKNIFFAKITRQQWFIFRTNVQDYIDCQNLKCYGNVRKQCSLTMSKLNHILYLQIILK